MRGDIVAESLQDIPNRAREITGHGVQKGVVVALTVAQTQSGNDVRGLHPVFPEGDTREDFEELVTKLD